MGTALTGLPKKTLSVFFSDIYRIPGDPRPNGGLEAPSIAEQAGLQFRKAFDRGISELGRKASDMGHKDGCPECPWYP